MGDPSRFVSQATVFILKNREWEEQGSGTVVFQFDTRNQSLILINDPDSKNEFKCRLKPRIRSKGPRAYVIRAESGESETGKMILAVRFEREKESTDFRKFVEANRLSGGGIEGERTTTADRETGGATGEGAGRSEIKRTMDTGGSKGPAMYRTSADYGYTGVGAGGGAAGITAAGTGAYGAPATATGTFRLMSGTGAHHSSTAGFFWTCPSCFQMNDAMAATCIVCSALRPVKRELSGMGGTHHAGAGAAGAPMYRIGAGMIPASGGGATAVETLELTVDNLTRHARYFPAQRRNVKDIIIDQIHWCMANMPATRR